MLMLFFFSDELFRFGIFVFQLHFEHLFEFNTTIVLLYLGPIWFQGPTNLITSRTPETLYQNTTVVV